MKETLELPRSMRNNNSGNIRWRKGNAWQGQTGHDKDGFCIFSSLELGARAQLLLLIEYYRDHHLLTIGQIVDRWTNADDQIRGDYKLYVSRRVGMDVHQCIYYYYTIIAIAYAMANFEAGEEFGHRRELEKGYELALKGASTNDALPLNA